MRVLTIFAIACSMLAPGAAFAAAVDDGSSRNAPCWKSGTTLATANCFAASGKKADADLNRTYAQIVRVLEGEDLRRLQKAERLWVAYRDAACDAEYGLWDGGTGGSPAKLACIDTETRRHLDWLRATYQLRLQRLAR